VLKPGGKYFWRLSRYIPSEKMKEIEMKRILGIAAVITMLCTSPLACADKTGHSGVGTVRSVDRTRGEVTLTHGQISDHNMPGMTIDFKVTDKRLFDRLRPGKQVAFEFIAERNRNVLKSVTPIADPGAIARPRK
jgi:Cu(I)/Ag(I) efflux system protein CusF